MSRHLKRVPMDFAWPLKQVWSGYLNPYYKLTATCPDCTLGHDRAGGRPDANAALFYAQWYGNAPFDPIAYGAEPLSQESPAIWNLARRNVERAPDFYMTPSEQHARRRNLQKAGVDLLELRKTAAELETHEQPGLVPIESFRGPAIAREAARLHALWRGQWCHHLLQADVEALVARRRLPELTHRPRSPEQALQLEAQAAAGGSHYWLEAPNGYHPTAAEVNAGSLGGMHDSINCGVCIEARCAREGVPYMCGRCQGTGTSWPSPAIQQQYDDWQPTDPPTGTGFQLWEDVSEGSPVSPVFPTLDALCEWAAEHATTFASFTATAEAWRVMLDGGVVHHQEGHMIFQ